MKLLTTYGTILLKLYKGGAAQFSVRDNCKKTMAITVFRKRGQTTARYDLHNAALKPEYDVRYILDRMDYCDELSPEHVFIANVDVRNTTSPFWSYKDELHDVMYAWGNKVQKKYEDKLYKVVTLADRKVLPLISKVTVKKKQKPGTPFLSQLKKDLTAVGRILRQDPSEVGQRLLDFTRSFLQVARSISLGRKVDKGFIFGFSHTKFCEQLGISKSSLNRLLNLAAGLGLVTKITPAEAKGIGEFWHKRWNVGMLQFRLDPLDKEEIERRWNLWVQSGIKLHDVTLTKIKQILGVDVETHPEVKNKSLRQVIKEANSKAQEEIEQRELEIITAARTVIEDPFKIGHSQYDIDIRTKYTTDEAQLLIADILNHHNSTCSWKWCANDKNPLLRDDTMISYSVVQRGRRIVYDCKRFSELPSGLLIAEWQFKTARKFARKVMDDLYTQGFLGIVQHVKNGEQEFDLTYHYFLNHMAEVRNYRNYCPVDPQSLDINSDIIEEDFDEVIQNLHVPQENYFDILDRDFIISRQKSTSL